MKISVIVPVFRVEEYLPDCIDSILNQSFTDYEVILVDDGSDNIAYKQYLNRSLSRKISRRVSE